MKLTTHDMPESHCLHCGKPCDACTGEDGTAPEPGSITICVACGHIMAFDERLKVRQLTDKEMVEVAGDPKVIIYQRALAELKKEWSKSNVCTTKGES